MATEVFKVPQTKRQLSETETWSPAKRKRIKETFLSFCDIVLAYTQYNSVRSQDLRNGNNRSPLDSCGSTADSFHSDTMYTSEEDQESNSPGNEMLADDTSFSEVSCFCGKPYMGRPMIECSVCNNWLHLSCVHLRKNNIPETFVCEACKRSPPFQKSADSRRKTQKAKLQKARLNHLSRATSYTPTADGVMRPAYTSPVNNDSSTYGPSFSSSVRGSDNSTSTPTGAPYRSGHGFSAHYQSSSQQNNVNNSGRFEQARRVHEIRGLLD